MTVAVLFYPT